jgi:NAD(P)-dependent dehydrogenase (short-subunit alcohol dehydrogenase family)
VTPSAPTNPRLPGEGLTGKTALVTGGTRGIGLAIVELLVEGGARVVVTARKQPELDRIAERFGHRVTVVRGGVDTPGHPEAAVRAGIEQFGSLDILVNNAATNPQYGALTDIDLSAFDKVMAVNLRAPLVFSRHAWSAWMAEHGGSIVNIASTGAFRIAPNTGAYNISKAGLVQLTRQLALEMAPKVRVNAVAPAVVRTEMASNHGEDPDLGADYPLGRIGEPLDVSAACAYLLSDAASWVTGTVLTLDGGALLLKGTGRSLATERGPRQVKSR